LIHLLDGLAQDPLADLAQINSELALFDEHLGEKPQLVALNKIDLPQVMDRWPELEQKINDRGYKPMAISAVTGKNVDQLLFKAAEMLAKTPEPEAAAELPLYRPQTDPTQFSIEQQDQSWRVSGEAIERAAAMTYWEYDQSIRRFQRIIETLGIDAALRQAGVKQGDTVFIGEHELEWED
jgi:GTP-binding protein